MIETMTKYTGNLGLKRWRKFKMYKHNFSPGWQPASDDQVVIMPLWSVEFHRGGSKASKNGSADVTRPVRFYRKVWELAFVLDPRLLYRWSKRETEVLVAFRYLILLPKDAVPQFRIFRLNVASVITRRILDYKIRALWVVTALSFSPHIITNYHP